MLQPQDIAVEIWPPTPAGGMRIGMPKGVKVTHRPTGLSATCDSARSQHQCRAIALAELEVKVVEAARSQRVPHGAFDRPTRTQRVVLDYGVADGVAELELATGLSGAPLKASIDACRRRGWIDAVGHRTELGDAALAR